jgi:hypothetical protein
MTKYKYTGEQDFYWKAGEVQLGRGDTIEVEEESELGQQAHRFEEVESEAESDSSDGEGEGSAPEEETESEAAEQAESESEGPSPPFDPAELTVSELEAKLEEGELSDEDLREIEKAEATGEGRSTALEAIEKAM